MNSFKKTPVKSFPRQGAGQTPDNLYWKKLQFPLTVQEFGPADYADFSADSQCFAVTASAKVKVYSSASNAVSKTFSKFTKTAYGGKFRKDGNLLCAGSEDFTVRVFDVANKNLLRQFKGHERAVHRCCFTADGYRVVSFSDDRTVALWDVGGEARLHSLTGHGDYVRAGTPSPAAPDVVVSGGYDHAVRVWDVRTPACTVTADHGAPVEAVLVFPSGGLMVSAGGTMVKVWDLVAGGRLLSTLSQHSKTVTCLTLCSEGKRLVSGSLDRRLKIYDSTSFQTVHTLEYPSPVLSLAIAPDDSKVVVGMADGLVSIQDRKITNTEEPAQPVRRKGQSKPKAAVVPSSEPQHKTGGSSQRLEKYDQHLRRFEFSRALDAALERPVVKKHPERTVAVLHELMRRGALPAAAAGRDGSALRRLCNFIGRHLRQPRFTDVLADAATVVVEVNADRAGQGDRDVDLAVSGLHQALEDHLNYLHSLLAVQGALDMVLAAAAAPLPDHTDRLAHPETPPPTLTSTTAALPAAKVPTHQSHPSNLT